MYSNVIQRLALLLTFKAGPQDLPSSTGLLQFSAASFLLFSVLRMISLTHIGEAVAQSLLSVIVLFFYVRGLLNWRQTPERLTQTLTALLLSGAFIGALLLLPLNALKPILLALAENPDIRPDSLEIPAMAAYAWAGVSLWGIFLSGHIFRHALSISFGLGIMATLAYEFLLISIVGVLSGLF